MNPRLLALLCLLLPLQSLAGAPGSRASEPLVDIHTVDPTISKQESGHCGGGKDSAEIWCWRLLHPICKT